MKALTIITPGRLAVFGRVLDELVEKGVLESWIGVPIDKSLRIDDSASERFGIKIIQLEGEYFSDRIEANRYLAFLESKYVNFDFGRLLAAQKRVGRYFPGGIVDIANTIHWLEQLIKENQIDVLIDDFPASLLDMAAYFFLKSRKLPTIFINPFRSGGRLLFCYEPEKGNKELISYFFEKYKKEGLPEKEREAALEYLRKFRSSGLKPDCYKYTVPRLIKYENYVSIDRWKTLAADLALRPSQLLERFSTQVRKLRLLRAWNDIFEPLDDRDRIICFPLHYQPEASTSVRAPYFKNQYALIENLCLCIPAGYTLYVKEHSRQLSRLSPKLFEVYKARFPNLKFVDLATDAHELIKKADLVVVLSGTAGWEAFLYGVPVLQFGRAFYSEFKGIYRFENQDNLKNQIREILENHRADENEMLMAIAAVFAGTIPGNVDDPIWDPAVTERGNIKQIVEIVKRAIEFYPIRKNQF